MNSQLNTICLSNDREYVLAAGDKITFFLMRLVDFTVVAGVTEEHYGGEGRPASFLQVSVVNRDNDQTPNLHLSVRTLRVSPEEHFVYLGLENGDVYVVAAKT